MCACVCMCVHVDAYVCMCVHVCACLCMYLWHVISDRVRNYIMCVCMCVHVCACVCMCVHVNFEGHVQGHGLFSFRLLFLVSFSQRHIHEFVFVQQFCGM